MSDQDGPPPAKRSRFLIEELLADGQPLEQDGAGNNEGGQEEAPPKRPEDYVKKLSSEAEHSSKFQCMTSKARYSIQDLPTDPEALIAGILQYSVDQATADSRERGIEPDYLGCTISSILLTGDVWHPVRPITADTVPSLIERFLEVAQSKKKEGVNLWGEPFTVNVTTIDKSKLPPNRQLKGGASKRKLAPVHHRIHTQCLIKINNPDQRNYCLFLALQATMENAIGGLTRKEFFNYMHSLKGQRGRHLRESIELMENVQAPHNQREYDAEEWGPKIIDYWNKVKFAGQFAFKLFIFKGMGHYKPALSYGPDNFNIPIILYHYNDHFDGVQKGGNLFGKPYCFSCEIPYGKAEDHIKTCKSRCKKCSRVGINFPCKETVEGRKCKGCNKTFYNDDCFKHHKESNYCAKNKQCPQCDQHYDIKSNTRNGREGHVCHEKYCPNCNTHHDTERGCFIQPLEPNKNQEKTQWRLVAFDMETMQHEPADPDFPDNGKRKHEPNFIAAKVSCPECIASGKWKNSLRYGEDECEVCGDNRTITFSHQPFKGTKVDKQVITRHPVVDFVKWIVYELPIKYKTVAFSHFGGRFDMILTFRELFLEGFNPYLIRKGNRFFEMKVKGRRGLNPDIIFRDSWNLIPTPLAGMVPMFGLDVEDKPFFPHMANRPYNYGCMIFPTKEDYLAGGMMPAKRKEFDRWYAENKNEPFLLDEALASYCTNDVEILMSGLIAFRDEFREMTKRLPNFEGTVDRACYKTAHPGIDPVRDCITIASACMKQFRTNHLKLKHLALVPEAGYDSLGHNQSLLALKFLDWYAWKHGVQIQTAYSEEGEKPVGKYHIDGWIEEQQKGIEVYGCYWHACPKCYGDVDMSFGKTAEGVREADKRRMKYLKQIIPNIDIYWECEIERMMEKDKEMRERFEKFEPEEGGPINIRKAFMGGRTGAWKLFHAAGPGETISYYDFTSLYPFINYVTDYPIGHPKLHVINEQVDWRKPEDNLFPLAMLKVFIIPPRKIDVPVLPVRVKQRLCFPTCMECCKQFPEGAVKENYSCAHTDKERGWFSTCTSMELEAALEEGYRVTMLLRVLNYEKGDNTLFRPYIREFYKEKMYSSGFDETLKGNYEAEEVFIRECMEKFEIPIDRAKMISNKGRRALAKLCLNNLWGRFSLRNYGLSQTLITDDPCELREHLDNKTIEVTSVDILTPETVLISYLIKKEFVEEHPCSNVVVSLFTTSAARLHLLKSMQAVARTPGCKLLYTDTDSLIFVHPTDNNPLKLGPHLGQFTDEYPHHNIVEFCSGGSKQYGLKLKRKDEPDADFEYILKVRGMTLNEDVINNQGLRYETFKQKVLQYARTGQVQPIDVVYPNFLRPSVLTGTVISAPLKKMYKPFVGNGIVCRHTLHVLPFGYISDT